jgi:hypothetical protein
MKFETITARAIVDIPGDVEQHKVYVLMETSNGKYEYLPEDFDSTLESNTISKESIEEKFTIL